jgi:hypothetical protein
MFGTVAKAHPDSRETPATSEYLIPDKSERQVAGLTYIVKPKDRRGSKRDTNRRVTNVRPDVKEGK